MSVIDFNPEKKSIEDLLVGADYYVIPRFQRPYSWEAANLEDFWTDVVFDNAIGYFIGPMVAWRDAKNPIRRIVDGQQRLTTIAIMFAVLRDQLESLGETRLADGVHRYLEKADRNNELQFTLQTETSSAFLSNAILKSPPDPTIEPSTEEEVALSGALQQVQRLIEAEVAKRQNPQKWLLELRDRLLGLKVIWVEHGNEDDAYIIFETLNSRGKDLEVVDLLKNHLLNRLRGTRNAKADTYRLKWDKMRDQLEASDGRARIDANRFILHWWQSRAEYVAQRKLFSQIKKTIQSKTAAQECLTQLTVDGPLYRAVIEPASRTWPIEEAAARDSLEALALFGVVQPAPLLLALMRARMASPKLSAAQFKKTLQSVERYHFQHTVVSQLSSSGGVSQMYAKAARDLYAAGANQQTRADVLKDIRDKLNKRRPDRDQFILAFQERFVFTNDYTRDKKIVQYVLKRLLRHANPTTGLDDLTIEHLMSQDQIAAGVDIETVGSIGNLLLVSEKVNSKLDNQNFAKKKKILDKEGLPYDIGGVLDQSAWSVAEIEARCQLLAETAYDKVWKLPV
ncbi:DUF262 domain-containing protein [Phycicoccus sp. CSK15P-2]|uniref:DUF262 domain-containing protein n=1 Tax=Phycicoccus sp. CSK15P-2 TaxID=2807627 RepID=UPI00194E69C5|nr:DUF262 domain-containing protein [Phycicoccus sp. CSK15P-2]MBM6403523.1 DUF262 domain-containing protein [Phycicoccus sp. CSK15P-2]